MLEMKYIFKQEKIMPQLMFNPGLTLSGFRTTRPRLFNSLPREIRHETCFNTFKTKVKAFLFRTAFVNFT